MPLVSSSITVSYEHNPAPQSSSKSGLKGYMNDDRDGTVDSKENHITSKNSGVKQKCHSVSPVQSTRKRPKTAVTSLECLQAQQRGIGDCLLSLIKLAISDPQQSFAVVDPLALKAYADPASPLCSKTPWKVLTKCTESEHLLLPFHHICEEHWTLFVYHKSQPLLVHYDSIKDNTARKLQTQVRKFCKVDRI